MVFPTEKLLFKVKTGRKCLSADFVFALFADDPLKFIMEQTSLFTDCHKLLCFVKWMMRATLLLHKVLANQTSHCWKIGINNQSWMHDSGFDQIDINCSFRRLRLANMCLYIFYRAAGVRLHPGAETPQSRPTAGRRRTLGKKRNKRKKTCHSPFIPPLKTLIYAKSLSHSPLTSLAGS